MKKQYHIPVLSKEILEYLNPKSNQNFVDSTLGDGGHSLEFLKKTSPSGKVLSIDLDKQAINRASDRLEDYADRLTLVQDNFLNIERIVNEKKFFPIHGILFDLGLSTLQLQSPRGFSFQIPGELSMQFNETAKGQRNAYQIINQSDEQELTRIFKEYGEIRNARALARTIREKKSTIKTSQDLMEIAKKMTPPHIQNRYLAQIFQALRIAVNNELVNITKALSDSAKIINKGGRIAVISYHSLEDRIVKNFFRQESKDCLCPPEIPICQCNHRATLKIITKKPITPSDIEIKNNSKARSAKLRIAERI